MLELNERLYLEVAEQLSVHSVSFISITVRFKHISDLPEDPEPEKETHLLHLIHDMFKCC